MKYRERTEVEALCLPAPLAVMVGGVEKTGKAGDYLVFKAGEADILSSAEFHQKYEQAKTSNPFLREKEYVPYPYPVYPSYPSYPRYWYGAYTTDNTNNLQMWTTQSNLQSNGGDSAPSGTGLLTLNSYTAKS